MSHRGFMLTVALALAVAGNAPRAIAASGPEVAPFECSSAVRGLLGDEGVPEPIFMSCTASATCYNGTTVNCTSATGTCTGINAACPSQRGYVQCGGTTTNCPACPTVGYGCTTVTCQNDAQCTAICPDPEQGGLCQTGCTPHSPVKTCFCLA